MNKTNTMKQKVLQFFSILFPIFITQIGLYSMNFFDTVMSGHAGSEDLAGVAIGSGLWVPVFTGLSGILLATTPIVAQLTGANQRDKVPFSVIQAIYLAIVISIFVMLLGGFTLNPLLNAMSLEQDVQMIASDYLKALALGMIPLFVYNVLRSFIDALGQTRVTMIITLLSLPINVGFNYVLIFGKLGFPALGGVGAGYASAITYWLITGIAFYVIHHLHPFSQYGVFKKWYSIHLPTWKEQLKIGVPIGFAIFFEVSIFSAVTILMSRYDTMTIAAHQAAMNFASLLYMIPLSISMALTIAVGYEAGAKRFKDASQYSFLGIGVAVGLSLLLAIILYLYRGNVAGLYSTDPEVLNLTAQFLMYAVFFQLSDAFGAPIQGALRGYKDVNMTLIMALVSYWIVGLPVGYLLANYTDMGPFGYWIGLITGLAVGAITLFTRLMRLQKKNRIKETAF